MRVAEIRELQGKATFVVKNIGLYPVVGVESGDVPAVGLAGARLLTETSRVTGLGDELSRVLSAWRRSWAVHDPGKIILDLAVCVALGGRCLADLSLLRYEKEVFGPVASDPTVSRLVGTLADHVEAVEAAVNRARRTVRQRVWDLAGEHSPTAGISAERPLVIDVDATLVNVHSDKEGAAPTVKPRVLWRLVYLVPVVAGCDCSWRWWSWWVSGAQAASCSAGVRIPMAECGRVVLNQWTHSAVATSTASMSSQGPWLRISSALYKEFRASARAKPKGCRP